MAITYKIWRFFLVDDAGKSYFVDPLGNVQGPQLTPVPLQHAPDGWEDETINYDRNSKYFGTDRTYTGTYKFVKDAAIIIRYLLYTQRGVQAKLFFIASKWTGPNFELYYKGECDLSEAADDPLTGITVPLIEGGPIKYIKANGSTAYEIPCNQGIQEAIQVLFDGVSVQASFTYSFVESSCEGTAPSMSFAIPFSYLSGTGQNFGVIHGSQSFEDFAPGAFFDITLFKNYAGGYTSSGITYLPSQNFFFRESVPTNFALQGILQIQDHNHNAHSDLKVMFVTSAGQVSTIYDGTMAQNQDIAIPFTVNLTLAANEAVFLLGYNYNQSGSDEAHIDLHVQSFTATFNSKVPESAVYVMKAADIYKQLIAKLTGNMYQGESSLLDSITWCVFSGENLRGNTDAVIKLSLDDLTTNSLMRKLGGALGIRYSDQTILFEKKSFFFDNTVQILDVGEVSNLKISIAKDHLFSTLKVGSTDQSTSQQSEDYEFNSESTFSSPIDRVTTILDLVSKIRCDSSGIEQMRADLGNTTDSDNKQGSSLFMADVLAANSVLPENVIVTPAVFTLDPYTITFPGKYAALQNLFSTGTVFGITASAFNNKVFTVISKSAVGADLALIIEQFTTAETSGGVVLNFNFYKLNRSITVTQSFPADPATVYNVDMRPQNDIRRNGDYLRIGLMGLPNELLSFTSSKKSSELIAAGIAENSSPRVNDLANPFALPLFLEFDTQVPDNVILSMQNAGKGFITGTRYGIRFYGFPESIAVKPSFRDNQNWKLLASTLTDLTALSRIGIPGLQFDNMGVISFKNSLQFVPEVINLPPQYHFQPMSANWFLNRIKKYDVQDNYFQKRQTNDLENLQIITEGVSIAGDIRDCHGAIVGTITFTNTANPAITNPNMLWLASIDWSDYPAGTYYVTITAGIGAGRKVYISEPIATAADYPNTVLIEYSNSINTPDMLFTPTGLFTGKMRVEGWLINFKPGMKTTEYEDQGLDVQALYGMGYRGYNLIIDIVPDYIYDKLSLIFAECDTTAVEQLGMVREPGGKWEEIDLQGSPYYMLSFPLREAKNTTGLTIDAEGEASGEFAVIDNINTKGFSSNQSPEANQQDNIVTITTFE